MLNKDPVPLKWLFSLDKPCEYIHHYNSLDKANVKSHNIDTLNFILDLHVYIFKRSDEKIKYSKINFKFTNYHFKSILSILFSEMSVYNCRFVLYLYFKYDVFFIRGYMLNSTKKIWIDLQIWLIQICNPPYCWLLVLHYPVHWNLDTAHCNHIYNVRCMRF